jgi:hypothetical protein
MTRVQLDNSKHEDAPRGHVATELALEFCSVAMPNLVFSRWLLSQGVDVGHVFNVAGPIAELAPVFLDTTLSNGTEKEWPS